MRWQFAGPGCSVAGDRAGHPIPPAVGGNADDLRTRASENVPLVLPEAGKDRGPTCRAVEVAVLCCRGRVQFAATNRAQTDHLGSG